MNLLVRRVGNSIGVILPKELAERYDVKEGSELKVVEGDGQFALCPQSKNLADQLKAARIGMAKYRVALRELAK
jgi:putative addiction module antidote